jgi:lipooligosaccharide transport system permease protein
MKQLFGFADWRSWAVFRRNARVYLRNWKTAFLPPAMEPIVYFLAFGLGLSGYVGTIAWHDQTLPYRAFIAPGLIAYAGFGAPFFEGLYSAYVRMFYQKTWDGILATQVELHHLLWGEILWAGARGALNSSCVAVVLAFFHFAGMIDIAWGWLLVLPIVCGISGCAFAALALVFTAIVPSIDHMNYPTFLIGVPVGLISNTFFPVHSDSTALQIAIELNPVYHLAETSRALLVGADATLSAIKLAVTVLGLLLITVPIVMRLMRGRVLGG